jgi:uncharacterized Ntn-hydrolase superfamily protein
MREDVTGTYSILAFDPDTGELGSASASCVLAVGGRVPKYRLGIGIVNTQYADSPVLAERILELMGGKAAPEEALRSALSEDDDMHIRQIIAIDFEGRKASWTGDRCDHERGHIVGEHCVAAGNTLAGRIVLEDMVRAFEGATGEPLGSRLLAAMEAAEAAGGDRRGRESASVLVVPKEDVGRGNYIIDLRVDHHDSPVPELRRLYGLL